jgi:hypothetical protein
VRPTAPDMTYFEKRFDGTRTFRLEGDRLHITGRNSLRSDFELTIDLGTVSPTRSLLRQRHRLFFMASYLLLAVVAVGVVADKMIVMSGAVVVALLLMAPSARKQTFYQFHFRSGGVAFDVCEAGPEKARAGDFVRAIVAAIPAQPSRAAEGEPAS